MAKKAGITTLDGTLDVIALHTAIHICVAEPANYADIAAQSRGSAVLAGGDFTKGNATPTGREITVAGKTITATGVTGTEQITHVVMEDGSSNFDVTTTTAAFDVVEAQQVNLPSFKATMPEVV
jgi:hypothetical protein